jgi:hypothetical protein
MAAPLVTGAVALLLSRHQDLTFDQIYHVLTSTADTSSTIMDLLYEESTISHRSNPLVIASSRHHLKQKIATCGGTPANVYPNNYVGYGQLNVTRAYSALKSVLDDRTKKRPKNLRPSFFNASSWQEWSHTLFCHYDC